MDLNGIEQYISEFHSSLKNLSEPEIISLNNKLFRMNHVGVPFGYLYSCSDKVKIVLRLTYNANPFFEIHSILNEDTINWFLTYIVDNETITHDLYISEEYLFQYSTVYAMISYEALLQVQEILQYFKEYQKKVETV